MMENNEERLISGSEQGEDMGVDRTLRPRRLDEYIGQTRVKENLEISIQAARQRGESLDHVSVSYTHLTLPTILRV